ncbi:uncharacterized protein LOC141666044 [Apium graveolens]|uniref:uncharacterized protein LOC141666044 n=1 Tax=Apium graveolens TaxID=4045 RepID=UPI003D7990E3
MAPPPTPQQNQSKARTFNMTVKEAVQNPSVVAGSLSVNSVNAKVLIDSRATRSFISKEFVDKLCYEVQWLGETLIIKLANDDQVPVDRVCPKSVHNAQIDCVNKKVNLRTADDVTVIFRGERQNKKILTMMQTKRLLRQGCKAYLAYVLDVNKEGPRIEDIPVVCKFPDVFPDELLGLPPD